MALSVVVVMEHQRLLLLLLNLTTAAAAATDQCPHDAAHGTCPPGGQLHLSFNQTHPLKAHQCVRLQTGRAAEALCFCPLGAKKVQTGMQSRVLFDSLGKWVLKVPPAP